MVIADIRTYIFDLRSPRLERYDLRAELATLIEEFGSSAPVQPRLEVSADPTHLRPEVGRAIIHIAREALANAVRHAQASRVHVELTQTGRQVVLVVRDNGRGFDPEQATARGGHGLRPQRRRARKSTSALNFSGGRSR